MLLIEESTFSIQIDNTNDLTNPGYLGSLLWGDDTAIPDDFNVDINFTSDNQILTINSSTEKVIANNIQVNTYQDTNTTINLSAGYPNTTSNISAITVTSFPEIGNIYQYPNGPGQVYGTQIDTNFPNVTDPRGRIIYVPRAETYSTTNDPIIASFNYTVITEEIETPSVTNTSEEATVDIYQKILFPPSLIQDKTTAIYNGETTIIDIGINLSNASNSFDIEVSDIINPSQGTLYQYNENILLDLYATLGTTITSGDLITDLNYRVVFVPTTNTESEEEEEYTFKVEIKNIPTPQIATYTQNILPSSFKGDLENNISDQLSNKNTHTTESLKILKLIIKELNASTETPEGSNFSSQVFYDTYIEPIVNQLEGNDTNSLDFNTFYTKQVKPIITELNSTITKLQSTITEIKSTIKEIKSTITELQSTITELNSTIARLKLKAIANPSDLNSIHNEIANVSAKITHLEKGIKGYEANINDLEVKIQGYEARITDLNTIIDPLSEIPHIEATSSLSKFDQVLEILKEELHLISNDDFNEIETTTSNIFASFNLIPLNFPEIVSDHINSTTSNLKTLKDSLDNTTYPETIKSLESIINSLNTIPEITTSFTNGDGNELSVNTQMNNILVDNIYNIMKLASQEEVVSNHSIEENLQNALSDLKSIGFIPSLDNEEFLQANISPSNNVVTSLKSIPDITEESTDASGTSISVYDQVISLIGDDITALQQIESFITNNQQTLTTYKTTTPITVKSPYYNIQYSYTDISANYSSKDSSIQNWMQITSFPESTIATYYYLTLSEEAWSNIDPTKTNLENLDNIKDGDIIFKEITENTIITNFINPDNKILFIPTITNGSDHNDIAELNKGITFKAANTSTSTLINPNDPSQSAFNDLFTSIPNTYNSISLEGVYSSKLINLPNESTEEQIVNNETINPIVDSGTFTESPSSESPSSGSLPTLLYSTTTPNQQGVLLANRYSNTDSTVKNTFTNQLWLIEDEEIYMSNWFSNDSITSEFDTGTSIDFEDLLEDITNPPINTNLINVGTTSQALNSIIYTSYLNAINNYFKTLGKGSFDHEELKKTAKLIKKTMDQTRSTLTNFGSFGASVGQKGIENTKIYSSSILNALSSLGLFSGSPSSPIEKQVVTKENIEQLKHTKKRNQTKKIVTTPNPEIPEIEKLISSYLTIPDSKEGIITAPLSPSKKINITDPSQDFLFRKENNKTLNKAIEKTNNPNFITIISKEILLLKNIIKNISKPLSETPKELLLEKLQFTPLLEAIKETGQFNTNTNKKTEPPPSPYFTSSETSFFKLTSKPNFKKEPLESELLSSRQTTSTPLPPRLPSNNLETPPLPLLLSQMEAITPLFSLKTLNQEITRLSLRLEATLKPTPLNTFIPISNKNEIPSIDIKPYTPPSNFLKNEDSIPTDTPNKNEERSTRSKYIFYPVTETPPPTVLYQPTTIKPLTSPEQSVMSPVQPSMSPVTPLTSPEQSVMSPVQPSMSPVTPLTSPEQSVMSPVQPSMSPVTPLTSPEQSVMSPVQPSMSPVTPLTSPEQSVMPPVQPSMSPVTPLTSPEQSVMSPVQPSMSPVTPLTSPEQSVMPPVQPSMSPVTPLTSPEQSVMPPVQPSMSPVTPLTSPEQSVMPPVQPSMSPVTPLTSPEQSVMPPVQPSMSPVTPLTSPEQSVMPPVQPSMSPVTPLPNETPAVDVQSQELQNNIKLYLELLQLSQSSLLIEQLNERIVEQQIQQFTQKKLDSFIENNFYQNLIDKAKENKKIKSKNNSSL